VRVTQAKENPGGYQIGIKIANLFFRPKKIFLRKNFFPAKFWADEKIGGRPEGNPGSVSAAPDLQNSPPPRSKPQ
jgi:hypothetical protein